MPAKRPIEKAWPVVLAAFGLIIFGGILDPWVDWDRIALSFSQYLRHPEPPAQQVPEVLLVSARQSHVYAVRSTVEPRGYAVISAESAAAGMELLGSKGERFAIVLVDTTLPESNELVRVARLRCRKAQVILLEGPQKAEQISALLMNSAVN